MTITLGGLVRGGRGRCKVFSSDGRIHVPATGNSYYPDVSVVCGGVETAPDDPDAMTNPRLLVEVLSDTTERFDRGRKFEDYRCLSSLQHYVLVAQDYVRVEHFRRNDDATWTLSIAEAGGVVRLPDLGVELPVDAIYEDVTLTQAEPVGT